MTDPDPVKDAPHVASVLKLAAGMQRNAIVLAAAVGVVSIVVAFLLRGGSGAVGAVVGVVIAGALGYQGTLVMAKTARASPAGVMIGAMTTFTGKIAFLLVFLLLFRGTALFDNQAFAFTMLAVTAAWIIGEVIGFVRTRIPVVDLATPTAPDE
jgi:ATP synthase protein I